MSVIKAPAKINLFLEVGKRDNSLHPIVSLVDIVSLYDYIYIKPKEKTEIKFISKWEIPKENTVSKLIRILKRRFNFDIEIKIKKNIPPGSGLGGGSSDAGILLYYLNKIFNFGLEMKDMIKIAKRIGSDVPLFLWRTRCIIRNYGDDVIPLEEDFKLYYLILIPQFPVKTEDVYNKLDEIGEFGDLTETFSKVRILINAIRKGDIEMAEEYIFNRLEKPCFEIKKEIKEVRDEVEKIINKKVFLSGSGGCLFSIFREKEEVKKNIKKILLKGWKKLMVESINFGM